MKSLSECQLDAFFGRVDAGDEIYVCYHETPFEGDARRCPNFMEDIMTDVRYFEIGEEVDVFIKMPGARKERGFYQQGVVKKKIDAEIYLVFFEHVECGGNRGQHGWYHWTKIFYKGRKPNEKSET